MSATSKPRHTLIELLEKEIATFGDTPCPLLSYQIDGFTTYYEILREDEMSLAKRTKQRRGERQRLCNNLTDIFLTIGAEVYLLGTLAAPMSILSTETSRELVPKLRLWWKSAPRPNALSLTAAELCSTYSIAALVSSCRKRKISRIANISGM